MNKLDLIHYLDANGSGTKPSAKTIVGNFKPTAETVNELKDQIIKDGIYNISSVQGGGLYLSGGINDEKQAYPHIEKNLAKWINSAIFGRLGSTSTHIQATHNKKLSGKWSTPDFTVLCTHKFLYVPTKRLDIVTVEVKHASCNLNVSSVYEALAHTRASSYGILFIYIAPTDMQQLDSISSIIEDIKVECVRFGIGLVTSDYPCDVTSWMYLIPAKEQSPDHRRIDEFIKVAFDKDVRDAITKDMR